jgi:hypothetical protein
MQLPKYGVYSYMNTDIRHYLKLESFILVMATATKGTQATDDSVSVMQTLGIFGFD